MRTKHGHQGRVKYWQHRPSMFCIYRTLIQQRLLVEFSCEFPLDIRLRDLLVVRSLDLECLVVATTVELDYFRGLCILQTPFLLLLLILDCKPCAQHQEEISQTLGIKGYTSQAGKAQPVVCILVHMCSSVALPCMDMVDSEIHVEGLCCRISL